MLKNTIIEYKPIRHGYARINDEGKLLISIPRKLKGNEWFLNALLEKGEKLLVRYKKKTHILTSDKDRIQIFGEIVSMTDFFSQHEEIWKTPSSKIQNLKSKILKNILMEYSVPLLDNYSKRLGIKYRKLTIRKTKSKRWSCTHDQKISLNLNLVHLPTKYIKYVIIHEICHLKIKNHSKKFWALVESFCPEYKTIRKEMRKFVIK